MIANSDGQRSKLYIGTPTGTAAVDGQAGRRDKPIPGVGGLLSGGVYRYTTMPSSLLRIYLPVVFKNQRRGPQH